jgi:hypothetical protein
MKKFCATTFSASQFILQRKMKVGATCERHFEHGSFAVSSHWICHGTFTRDFVYEKKWAQAVDMNHGLDLGGIEVI